MSEIFHYTSIASLALILKSNKIRFSRLDGVDDILEAQTHVGINFGQYFFVSCWTKTKEESIPQWHMYGNDMKGIRIQMPPYPFRRVALKSGNYEGLYIPDGTSSPLSWSQSTGEDYLILPPQNDDFLYGSVNYVSDVNKNYASRISREPSQFGGERVVIKDLPTLARLKSDSWQFQDEYRFQLLALPSPKSVSDRYGQALSNAFLSNIAPSITYIDVPLKQGAFDELVVTMGPKSSASDLILVEALLNQYAPNAKVEESALSGTIR
ncbi:TPA: DUF2971 domain-containing protein [Vibrio parahaemolyticus]